ncbi:probable phosphomevalonate kinase isoform X2 [Harmonia axyridis]|uniref:probable phosphomevalonate kinase isoform X2 n=1 Tax=Harmonia axyridis TaxID=115357 RepID=UPI001E277BEF|nr:probable phosphomevalonate kinase isoform X2 [Harmonia axyridis]
MKLLLDKCTIIRISEPIKKFYAEKCAISLTELMGNGPLKEKYRIDMINWSDKIRFEDPGRFCRSACENAKECPFWIVCDIRRKTDIDFFKKTYDDRIKTVRINARESIRKARGWIFTKGVDDVASECDLDSYQNWDLEISNEESDQGVFGILQLLDKFK